jgi:transposase
MVLEQQEQHESQWSAITSIAEKIGCTAETEAPRLPSVTL